MPRPETELLAGAVLTELSELDSRTESDEGRRPFVIDLCSGTGAISLSVATESERVDVLGVEREPAALDWSLKNLEHSRLGESTVEFILGDASTITEARPELRERADIVVTNRPMSRFRGAADPRSPTTTPRPRLWWDSVWRYRLIIRSRAAARPADSSSWNTARNRRRSTELLAATASLRHAATFQDYTGRDRIRYAARRRRRGDDSVPRTLNHRDHSPNIRNGELVSRRFDVSQAEIRELVFDECASRRHRKPARHPHRHGLRIAADAFSASSRHCLRQGPRPGYAATGPRPRAETIFGLVDGVDETVLALTAKFWPGPLTIIANAQPSLDWDSATPRDRGRAHAR